MINIEWIAILINKAKTITIYTDIRIVDADFNNP